MLILPCQRAKKVVCSSLGLMDFAIRLGGFCSLLSQRASAVFWEIQITEGL